MVEVRREVSPLWPYRLPRAGPDGVMRRGRDGGLERLLHVDGVCGDHTWAALVEAGWRLCDRPLYLSSPIGLGHVRRDLAVADAMREQRPDLEVQWLTQSPVADFLEQPAVAQRLAA